MPADSLHTYVLDQLRGLGRLRDVAMFGGHGFYRGEVFFAILFKGRLYFKTDAATRERYLAQGMKPFRPKPGMTLKTYFEVPSEVIDDVDTLIEWAREACSIERNAKKKTQSRQKTKRARLRKRPGA